MRKQWKGAPHATEIPYVFDTVSARYGKDLTAADAAAAKAMHAYWVGFARTGVPQAAGLPAWPAYQPATDQIMDFTLQGPVAGPDPWKARMDLAQRFSSRYLRFAQLCDLALGLCLLVLQLRSEIARALLGGC